MSIYRSNEQKSFLFFTILRRKRAKGREGPRRTSRCCWWSRFQGRQRCTRTRWT